MVTSPHKKKRVMIQKKTFLDNPNSPGKDLNTGINRNSASIYEPLTPHSYFCGTRLTL